MSRLGATAQCLVVVELGAACPAFVADMRSECLLFEQLASESGVEFARRVEDAVRSTERANIALAVLVCAEDGSDPSARRRSALFVADALAESGGELLLMADPGAAEGVRKELFELAETLCERLVGTSVGVRVRFTELQSGVGSVRPVAGCDPSASNGG